MSIVPSVESFRGIELLASADEMRSTAAFFAAFPSGVRKSMITIAKAIAKFQGEMVEAACTDEDSIKTSVSATKPEIEMVLGYVRSKGYAADVVYMEQRDAMGTPWFHATIVIKWGDKQEKRRVV